MLFLKQFIFLTLVTLHSFSLAQATNLTPVIEYKTVNEALRQLRLNPTSTESPADNDLTKIFNNSLDPLESWFFVTEKHYAYPTVFKTYMSLQDNGLPYFHSAMLCESSKDACARFSTYFDRLNKKMKDLLDSQEKK